MLEHPSTQSQPEGTITAPLPWLDTAAGEKSGIGATTNSPCIPDEDLELEWIHGYSAQVKSNRDRTFLTGTEDLSLRRVDVAESALEEVRMKLG